MAPLSGYHLGVDLGTTFTAAAVSRHGRTEPFTLGTDSVAMPSVAYLGDQGELLFGRPAVRRATAESPRVAREFKRRVGDPTPMLLGGTPIPAEMLMARLLAWVVEQVSTTEGAPPTSLAVTHPAIWGRYKLDMLTEAISHVGLTVDHLVAEPVAAATFYATQRPLTPGEVVAVYDLGGGTFDAALVRATPDNFEIIGQPDGLERLGGVDVDHAVMRHVTDAIGLDLDQLEYDNAALTSALSQLRLACVDAKEALSVETDVSIPVMLPERHTEVRLTRAELEAMIRPTLDETLVTLRRTITSADLTPADITAVLLVGGSSRIPLVGQLVAAELERPVAVDARPKDAISMGAALAASQRSEPAPLTAPPPPVPPPPLPPPPAGPPPAMASGPPQAPPSDRERRWRWGVATALAVAAVSMLAVGAFLVLRDDDSDTVSSLDTTTTAPETDTTSPDTTHPATTTSLPSAGEPSLTQLSATSQQDRRIDVTFTYDLNDGELESCTVTVGPSETSADCSGGSGSASFTVPDYATDYNYSAEVVTSGGTATAEATTTSEGKPLTVDGAYERWGGSCYYRDHGTSRPVMDSIARCADVGSSHYLRMAPDGSSEEAQCWRNDIVLSDDLGNESGVWVQVGDGWMNALYFTDWASASDNLPTC